MSVLILMPLYNYILMLTVNGGLAGTKAASVSNHKKGFIDLYYTMIIGPRPVYRSIIGLFYYTVSYTEPFN